MNTITPKAIKVYVKLNENNHVMGVNSSVFMQDTTGWVEIDEGHGDTYCHAQGNYFPNGIFTINGQPKYQLIDGKIKDRIS